MDLDIQDETNKLPDPTEAGKFHIIQDEQDIVLKVDMEGNVILWDEDKFVNLCEESDESLFKVLLTLFNLGILAGHRDS